MEDGSPNSFEVVMSAEQHREAVIPACHAWIPFPHPSSPLASRPWRSPRGNRRLAHRAARTDEAGIQSFALPYGDHNASTIEICRTAGYEIVFSTIPAPVDTTDTAFVRGRVKTDPFDGRLEFFLKYNGAYAWAPYLSALKRRLRGYKPSAAGHGSSLGQSAPYKQSKR